MKPEYMNSSSMKRRCLVPVCIHVMSLVDIWIKFIPMSCCVDGNALAVDGDL